jgi:predicted Zn-dependent protease
LTDIQKNAQKNLALDLASAKSGGLAGEAARAVARVGLEGYVRGLSREDELAADRMAVVITARSGYEPYGLVAVLQTLAAMPQDDSAFFLKTHPPANDRIAALEAEMPASFESYATANPALGRYNKVFPAKR